MNNQDMEILKSIILDFPNLPTFINEESIDRFFSGKDPFPQEKYFFLGELEILKNVKLSERLIFFLREKVNGPILKIPIKNIGKAFDLKKGMNEESITTHLSEKELSLLDLGQIFDLVKSNLLTYVSIGSIILPIRFKNETFLVSSSFIGGITHLDYLDPRESGFIQIGIVFANNFKS